MEINKIDLKDTGQFSTMFLNYIQGKEEMKNLFGLFPALDNFGELISRRKFPARNRDTLCQVLQQQYQELEITPAVENNLTSLAHEKTFTIVTGHQLNIFTGPLYFIYKIITVINACRELKEKYPDYHFVPVYWMATEDHDFEEISHFRFDGKNYKWETEQQGPVGRFTTEGLEKILEELPAAIEPFKYAYTAHNSLADAVRYYVNSLFGEYGLVVVDADNKELKKLFSHVIEADIIDHTPFIRVSETNQQLGSMGYTCQVFAREINFFYMEDGLRSRIEKEGDNYRVVDTSLEFSEEEIRHMISESPEKFSPNVILRPLYQETILPNLAYVGGPAEVVYWMQLKKAFDHFETAFPTIMPRNFAMYMPPHISRKFNKSGLSYTDLFSGKNALLKKLTLAYSDKDIQLNGKKKEFEDAFARIQQQAEAIDATLGPMVAAEAKRTFNKLNVMEKKMLRAEKRNLSDRLDRAETLKDYLFPNGNLQERTDNFLNYYLGNPDFIPRLVQAFTPFDFRFHILKDE
ncbi:MAG: bacillithiol biosynthesis cysteine-adding enzyme BshC [Cyclobacteriaceae bacterium]|nr:bacillithiol biosynthesis cysteine-adding enzyme BshC [Cyclobacteriaceae bacterium]